MEDLVNYSYLTTDFGDRYWGPDRLLYPNQGTWVQAWPRWRALDPGGRLCGLTPSTLSPGGPGTGGGQGFQVLEDLKDQTYFISLFMHVFVFSDYIGRIKGDWLLLNLGGENHSPLHLHFLPAKAHIHIYCDLPTYHGLTDVGKSDVIY